MRTREVRSQTRRSEGEEAWMRVEGEEEEEEEEERRGGGGGGGEERGGEGGGGVEGEEDDGGGLGMPGRGGMGGEGMGEWDGRLSAEDGWSLWPGVGRGVEGRGVGRGVLGGLGLGRLGEDG